MTHDRDNDEAPVVTTPTKARQGVISHRVITILVISLAIAMVAWGAVEIYYQAETPEPAGESQMLDGPPRDQDTPATSK